MRFAIRCCALSLALSLPLSGVNFYKVEVIASTGQAVGVTGSLSGMGTGPSVNRNGVVVFVGQFPTGEALVVGDGTNPLKIVSFSPSSSRVYQTSAQIN